MPPAGAFIKPRRARAGSRGQRQHIRVLVPEPSHGARQQSAADPSSLVFGQHEQCEQATARAIRDRERDNAPAVLCDPAAAFGLERRGDAGGRDVPSPQLLRGRQVFTDRETDMRNSRDVRQVLPLLRLQSFHDQDSPAAGAAIETYVA